MPVVGKRSAGSTSRAISRCWATCPPRCRDRPTMPLKKAGVPLLGYGEFITQAVNFVIIAFIIFLIVIKAVNRAVPSTRADAPTELADVALLREIRDELRARKAQYRGGRSRPARPSSGGECADVGVGQAGTPRMRGLVAHARHRATDRVAACRNLHGR